MYFISSHHSLVVSILFVLCSCNFYADEIRSSMDLKLPSTCRNCAKSLGPMIIRLFYSLLKLKHL